MAREWTKKIDVELNLNIWYEEGNTTLSNETLSTSVEAPFDEKWVAASEFQTPIDLIPGSHLIVTVKITKWVVTTFFKPEQITTNI